MTDYLDQLERLADLLQRGVLSKQEFETQKASLLSQQRIEGTVAHRGWLEKFSQRRVLVIGGLAILVLLTAWSGYTLQDEFRPAFKDTPVEPSRRSSETLGPIRLGEVLDLDTEKGCAPGPRLSALLRAMETSVASGSFSGAGIFPGSAEIIKLESATFGSNVDSPQVIRARLIGQWNDLPVTEIRRTTWPDASGFQIRFGIDIQRAASALTNSGLQIGTEGKLVERPNGFHGLETIGNGSALTCINTTSAPNNPDANTDAE